MLLRTTLLASLLLAGAACTDERPSLSHAHAQREPRRPSEPERAEPRAAPRAEVVRRATLASVGDVLPHLMVKAAARARARRSADGRDENHAGFDDVLAGLRGALDAYDLASFNMESPVVAEPLLPHARMRFFADPALPAALHDVGFDLAVCANNHAFDQGPDGLVETHRNLRALGLDTVGCGPDQATARAPVVREVNGIRIAVLAFARILNAYNPARRAHPEWPQVLFWYGDEPAGREVLEAVRDARSRADVVVVDAHWDREYQPSPLGETRRIGRMLVDAGADLVVGHHPHVLQPAEWLRAADGRRAVVIYSHGNFVSEMCPSRAPLDLCDRRLSAISVATFEAHGDGPAHLADVRFEPAWMDHRGLCPGEASARTACVRPIVLERELERLAAPSAEAPSAEALAVERRGHELRRDVIRRFMGPHDEGAMPAHPGVGFEAEVRGRGRDARGTPPTPTRP